MNKWPIVKLSEIVCEEREPIGTFDGGGLPIYGVTNIKGVTITGVKPSEDRTKYLRLRPNRFIYNPYRINVGSFGLSAPDQDGIASPAYVVFHCRENLESKFLLHYLQSHRGQSLINFHGNRGTVRAALRFSDLSQIEIPLPPLPEQQRIVARIETLTAKIEEARGLCQKIDKETGVLGTGARSQILDNPRWEFKRLKFVLAEPPRNGLSPQRETETNGRPMLRINAVSSTPNRFVDLSAYKKVEVSEDVARSFVLQHDDVFIVRYNGDINRVAKAAIFKGEESTKVVYPDKLMRLRTDMKKMLPDFLVFALGSRTVREQIEELGKTTAGQIGISGADAKSFIIPVPPLDEQRRIVAYLDGLQAKVDALKKLQSESVIELDALLPSILNKAFKGEL